MTDSANSPPALATLIGERAAPRPHYSPSRGMSPPEIGLPNVAIGFGSLQSWEFTQRVARGLASSSLVPEAFRLSIPTRDGSGHVDNPSGLANCIVALNMATRMGADPLMVMQHLYIVEGRPSWSSQFIIATINACGRFSSLQFRMVKEPGEREVHWTETKWEGPRGNRTSREVERKMVVRPMSCTAYATDRATGEVLEGPEITTDMALAEGWYQRAGSKWRTMPEVMFRYRAASFFGRLYAPELLMGLRTQEEEQDALDATRGDDGAWEVSERPAETDRAKPAPAAGEPQPAAAQESTPARPAGRRGRPPKAETAAASSAADAAAAEASSALDAAVGAEEPAPAAGEPQPAPAAEPEAPAQPQDVSATGSGAGGVDNADDGDLSAWANGG